MCSVSSIRRFLVQRLEVSMSSHSIVRGKPTCNPSKFEATEAIMTHPNSNPLQLIIPKLAHIHDSSKPNSETGSTYKSFNIVFSIAHKA